MAGDLFYAAEKYGAAVDIMATSHRSLWDRLIDAYLSQASRASPPMSAGGSMPDELESRIMEFHGRLTAVAKVGDGSSYEATIRKFTEDEVKDAAQELVGIYFAIEIERLSLAKQGAHWVALIAMVREARHQS